MLVALSIVKARKKGIVRNVANDVSQRRQFKGRIFTKQINWLYKKLEHVTGWIFFLKESGIPKCQVVTIIYKIE